MNRHQSAKLYAGLYERTCQLVGPDAMNAIKQASVFVAGLGGVGGYVVENLVRAGVGTIGLCDYDRLEDSNLNRQVIALSTTIGLQKTEAASERCLLINSSVSLRKYETRIDKDTVRDLSLEQYDYVADAIDDVAAKIVLIQEASRHGTPIISAMGCGNKIDPFRFRIAPIESTHSCPLAKAVRKKLKLFGITGIPVLFSDEPGAQTEGKEMCSAIPSISYMPAVAGSMIASYILRHIIDR